MTKMKKDIEPEAARMLVRRNAYAGRRAGIGSWRICR